jgi:hypothetical protein
MTDVTLWCVRVTIHAPEKQQSVLCVLLRYISLDNNIKILIVAQKCLYGEFMSPATTKDTWVLM